MKARMIAAVACMALTAATCANADTLRLRNGTELAGRYVGGTEAEIWFLPSNPGLFRPVLYIREFGIEITHAGGCGFRRKSFELVPHFVSVLLLITQF